MYTISSCKLDIIGRKVEELAEFYSDNYNRDGVQFPLVNMDNHNSGLSTEIQLGTTMSRGQVMW